MKKTFNIKGMTCASCQSHVQKAVDKLEGINNCNVNLLQNNMFVEFDEKICSVEKIEKAVKDAGYSASLPEEKISHFIYISTIDHVFFNGKYDVELACS